MPLKKQWDKIMENISTLQNSSSILTVTLHENKLMKDGTYYATVSRNTATFKNLLSEIAEDNKGMDPYMLQFAAILMQKKILKMLEQGKAVNVLDLGTLYIAVRGSAKGKSDVTGNGEFCIKFSPTPLANEALSKLGVDKVVYADGSPEITGILDLSPEPEEKVLKKGSPCRIRGSRLKIGGEKSGVYFVPVGEDGKMVQDEVKWILVDEGAIFRNMPSELNFIVPAAIEEGDYRIVIRTSYLSKDKSRKSLVECTGGQVPVKA